MKQYHHLTQRERYLIEYYLSMGKKQKEVAELLGCSPSTISREIRRNKYVPLFGEATYDLSLQVTPIKPPIPRYKCANPLR